ncbi:MAG: BatD family protein [Acidobacteriota bacterium]|nr:MAG: BatD family protein [Acidobacteriota bacterium]
MNTFILSLLLLQVSDPLARTRVEPGAVVTVGQPVSIVVEVLVPSYFMGAPGFPDVDVPDALVIFEARGTNFTERIDGETFAGQSRRYTIYPQRAGDYEIPEIPVTVRYFSGSGPADATVSPASVQFAAQIPAEADGLGYFIATSNLSLDERIAPETHELKVGEALTRTLTITVDDALSMVIPPVSFEPIPGLGVYPEPPVVTDSGGERGQAIVGTRVEAVSYVAELEGSYRLPAVELTWWDVNAERLRSASAPAVDLEVVANPDLATEFALPEDDLPDEAAEEDAARVSILDRLKRFGIPMGALGLLTLVLYRLVRRYRPGVEPPESEQTSFRHFRKAARSGDAAATARTLMRWLDRRRDRKGPALFSDFAEAAADPALERHAKALGDVLYAKTCDPAGWSGKELYRRVDIARKKRAPEKNSEAGLPALNP